MIQEQIFAAVLSSQPSEWHTKELRNSQDGYAWVATLKSNASIKLKWGRVCNDDFDEPWVQKLFTKKASSEYAEILHEGLPALTQIYISVEGGKGMIPMPRVNSLEVPAGLMRFVCLLNALSKNPPTWLDASVKAIGLEENQDKWPNP